MSERLKSAVRTVSLLLISLWLGATLFFSAVVAPTVFDVLRGHHLANANEIAGAIVTRSLAIISGGGLAISLALLVTAFVFKLTEKRAVFVAEVISLAIMSIMTALGQWVIAARMLALRTAMQAPIDQIAREDPRRVAFDSLHHYSVAALGIAMAAGLVAWIAMSQRQPAKEND
jgi:MFS family permease